MQYGSGIKILELLQHSNVAGQTGHKQCHGEFFRRPRLAVYGGGGRGGEAVRCSKILSLLFGTGANYHHQSSLKTLVLRETLCNTEQGTYMFHCIFRPSVELLIRGRPDTVLSVDITVMTPLLGPGSNRPESLPAQSRAVLATFSPQHAIYMYVSRDTIRRTQVHRTGRQLLANQSPGQTKRN